MRALVVIALVVIGGPAWAGKKTLVFPLATKSLPPSLGDSSLPVTRAIAESIDGSVAKVPIEDAAEVLGCDVENTACLEKVADSLGVNRLVFGTLQQDDDRIRLTLTRFDVGPSRQQRTFDLAARTPDGLATEAVRAASPLFADAQRVTPSPAPAVEPAGPRVTTGTWAIVGTGVVLGVAGTTFLLSAQGLRDQVASTPKVTDADFKRLVDLENQGKTRTYVGDALVITGGVVATIGVIRAIVQSSSKRDSTARIDAVPTRGGATVVFTLELR